MSMFMIEVFTIVSIQCGNGKYYALWDNGIDDRPHSRHIYSNTHIHTYTTVPLYPKGVF